MITCKQIIDKFCQGPVSASHPDMVAECEDCTTLEDLMETVNSWMDFDNSAQAALFVLNYLDYEID